MAVFICGTEFHTAWMLNEFYGAILLVILSQKILSLLIDNKLQSIPELLEDQLPFKWDVTHA